MIYLLLPLLTATAIWLGFTVWWLHAFPIPPLLEPFPVSSPRPLPPYPVIYPPIYLTSCVTTCAANQLSFVHPRMYSGLHNQEVPE